MVKVIKMGRVQCSGRWRKVRGKQGILWEVDEALLLLVIWKLNTDEEIDRLSEGGRVYVSMCACVVMDGERREEKARDIEESNEKDQKSVKRIVQ